MRVWLISIVVTLLTPGDGGAQSPKATGVRLENHTWVEAQALLNENAVIVVPLGATLKEHGPHLIEAYRYTVTQQAAVPPTLLKKPGYPEIIK